MVLTPASATPPPTTPVPVPGILSTPRLVAVTDQNGNFSLPKVPAGTYNVTVHKFGYQPGTASGIVVAQGANTAIPTITLVANPTPTFGTVTGQVTDAGGAAIANALVEIAPTPPPATGGASTGTIPIDPLPVRFTRTDQSGNYTFGELRTGNYTITATAQGYQPNSENVTVAQGANTAPLLQLTALPTPTFASVTGSVTDAATGNGLAGAIVALVRAIPVGGEMGSAIVWPLPLVTTTDSSGNFSFAKVPTGNYTLDVLKEGYQRSSTQVTITAPTTALPAVQLTALPTPVYATVTGEVDANGGPLANAYVVIAPAPPPLRAAARLRRLPASSRRPAGRCRSPGPIPTASTRSTTCLPEPMSSPPTPRVTSRRRPATLWSRPARSPRPRSRS